MIHASRRWLKTLGRYAPKKVFALAQEPSEKRELVDDIPPPPRVKSGETLEPDVTIIRQEDKVIEQYSVNGQVYAAKITPKKGRPYYLIDTDGDGSLDTRNDNLQSGLQVPQWVIFSWR